MTKPNAKTRTTLQVQRATPGVVLPCLRNAMKANATLAKDDNEPNIMASDPYARVPSKPSGRMCQNKASDARSRAAAATTEKNIETRESITI